MIKALLIAMLEPTLRLKEAEEQMDFTQRLAMFEEQKSLPWAAVWDYYCLQKGVPVGAEWFQEVRRYEEDVLSVRGFVAVV